MYLMLQHADTFLNKLINFEISIVSYYMYVKVHLFCHTFKLHRFQFQCIGTYYHHRK